MNSAQDLSVSCLIPMHNEQENAAQIIAEAELIFSRIVRDWEIVIVESGSTDGTWEKINVCIRGKDRIRAFHQERKEGMGSALKLGYAQCAKEVICHLEADSPFEVEYFRKALPILLENDCVIGFRIGRKEDNFRWSYHRKGFMTALERAVFHVGYNLLLRFVFGLVVRDVNFSFKIFKRKYIPALDLVSDGWFIDTELLLAFKRIGILPVEMPIEYKDRRFGRSTVSFSTPFGILREMIKYIRRRRRKDAA